MENMFRESHDKLSGNVKTYPDWCTNLLLEMSHIVGTFHKSLVQKDCRTPDMTTDMKSARYLNCALILANYMLNNPDERILYTKSGLDDREINAIETILGNQLRIKKDDKLAFETMYDDLLDMLGKGEEAVAFLAAVRYISLLNDSSFYGECLDFDEKYRGEDLDALRYFGIVDHQLCLKDDQKLIDLKYEEIEETIKKIIASNVSYQQVKIMYDAMYTMILNINKGAANKFTECASMFDTGANIDNGEHFLLTHLCFDELPNTTNAALVTDLNIPFMDCSGSNLMFKKAVELYTNEIRNKTNILGEAMIVPNNFNVKEVKNKITYEFEDIYYSTSEYITILDRYIKLLEEHLPKILDYTSAGIIIFMSNFKDLREHI